MKSILLTGGCGYIGSHTCIPLLEKGFKLIVVDSNINSSHLSLERLQNLTRDLTSLENNNIVFFKGDIRDEKFLKNVFLGSLKNGNEIEAVIHFAGLKAVAESVKDPLMYWDNNVLGSITLFKVMDEFNCRTIVFSSSATVYGINSKVPMVESSEIKPNNPYGHTKAAVEFVLEDIFNASDKIWKIANLRYFNPIGAHSSGLIGEEPSKKPNNLFPIICRVALGKYKNLEIFGSNWPTNDGTAIRDYIHVMDLAESHVCALEYLISNNPQFISFNIGTGLGTSVLEIVNKFKEVNRCNIPYQFCKRRPGDAPIVIANNKLATLKLNWKPKRNLEDMCRDGWKWQKLNPNGYK